jgi:hypothetical protein
MWKLVAVLLMTLFSFASFAPTHAISAISLNPGSVATGGTVTITITQVVGPGPDIFASLKITDPLGNAFSYNGAPFSVGSGNPQVITFPDPGMWTLVSGPGGDTGTDVSGMYHVMGTYLDTSLSALLGRFVVLSYNGNFNVPEFNQSILLLVGMIVPALLLVRKISLKHPI